MITGTVHNKQVFVILTVLVLAMSAGCSRQRPDSFGFTEDDYAVYRTVATQAAPRLGKHFLLCGRAKNINWGKFPADPFQRIPAEYHEAIDAFLAIDSARVDWTGLTTLGFKVMDRDSIGVFNRRQFEQRSGEFQNSLELGPIGYDRSRYRAIVYCALSYGNVGGEGRILLLKRVTGAWWEVVDTILLWMA